jgi:thiamine-monophosphate kinase
MAGSPLCAVVSVALPANCDETTAREIQAGLSEMGESTGCPLVGGDVGVWPGALAVTVTVLGRPGAGGPIRRRGGRPGDTLVVTGRLGGAWRTDRHLTFTPRLTEARALVDAAGGGVHAMIDLSDGLATDLHHICRESGCAAELHAPAIPIHPDARHAGDGQDALQAALTDGEDYELLLAVAPDQADALLASPPIEAELTAVGRLVAGEGITLVDPGGRATPLTPGGWEHGR